MFNNSKTRIDSKLFGQRSITPTFHVLIRQSSGRFSKKKRRYAICALILVLGTSLIGTLLFLFVLKDIIYGTTKNSTLTYGNGNNSKSVYFPNKDRLLSIHDSEYKCPNIRGVSTYNKVTALFGGLNEHDARVNTIEVIPKLNCPSFPRFLCLF